MSNVALKGLVLVALLVLPLGTRAETFPIASNTAKISRVRINVNGQVFIGIAQTPTTATNDCPPGFLQSELYYFDGTTLQGRILYNQVLAAYTSQSKVAGGGGGVNDCIVFGVSPFFSRFERLTSLTVFFP